MKIRASIVWLTALAAVHVVAAPVMDTDGPDTSLRETNAAVVRDLDAVLSEDVAPSPALAPEPEGEFSVPVENTEPLEGRPGEDEIARLADEDATVREVLRVDNDPHIRRGTLKDPPPEPSDQDLGPLVDPAEEGPSLWEQIPKGGILNVLFAVFVLIFIVVRARG